ncbi:MAG: hypothetical protein KDK70_32030 [Myxococcales bacterium]|nr:hypothetical protein [Myxococcales bacterium]
MRLGEVFMLFGRAGVAPEDRMNAIFDQLRDPGVKTIVGASIGSIRLTSVQRKRLSECAKDRKLMSIMDHNPIARGIVTALGWFGLKIRLFYWSELPQALDWVAPAEIEVGELQAVLSAVYAFLSGEDQQLPAAS